MNTYQQRAYASPCYNAEDTVSRRYFHLEGEGRLVSVLLTANVGLE